MPLWSRLRCQAGCQCGLVLAAWLFCFLVGDPSPDDLSVQLSSARQEGRTRWCGSATASERSLRAARPTPTGTVSDAWRGQDLPAGGSPAVRNHRSSAKQRNTRRGAGTPAMSAGVEWSLHGAQSRRTSHSDSRRLRLSKVWHLTRGHKRRKWPQPGRRAGPIGADARALLAGATGSHGTLEI